MVRTQLYLPDELYEGLKENAKVKGMSFAAYARVYLEKGVDVKKSGSKKTIYEVYPFMKFAGMLNGKLKAKDLTNEELDKAVYDL